MRTSLRKVFFMAILATMLAPSLHAADKRLLAYYEFSDQWNTPPYTAANIPFNELTHIIHSNIAPGAKADGSLWIPDGFLEPALLKNAHAAGVKVLVCVSGDPQLFVAIVGDSTARATFAANLQKFVQTVGYDGVDFDWEVPNNKAQAENFVLLLQQLRTLLPSPKYQISAAVSSTPFSWGVYDFPGMTPVLDFYNVMTYDFHGPWTNHSGHNSPLYLSPEDPGQEGSVKSSIDDFLTEFKVPAEKLNLGTAFYGYIFNVANLWDFCVCTGDATSVTFAQVQPLVNNGAWTRNFDALAQAPYLVHDSRAAFITYDDEASTARKTTYVIKDRDLGGIFMWELSQDYNGTSQNLMTAMYKAFARASGQ